MNVFSIPKFYSTYVGDPLLEHKFQVLTISLKEELDSFM